MAGLRTEPLRLTEGLPGIAECASLFRVSGRRIISQRPVFTPVRTMTRLQQWPDDVPDSSPAPDFDARMAVFMDQFIASDGTVHADDSWSLFGFSRGNRRVDFVRRGLLRPGAGLAWEVWPHADGESLQLGPLFGIRPYACVVISGFDDLCAVTNCWLNGSPLESLLSVATFWDKMDTSTPLESVA